MNSENLIKDAFETSISVLVMGGLGFMGSHLCRSLLRSGYRISIFDKLHTSHELIVDIEEQIDVFEGDIQKSEDILTALAGIDVVIDLIHTTVPGSSMQNPVYDVQSNIIPHVNFLTCLKEKKVKKIIYVSSGGTVYGPPKTVPIKENHPTNPISSYGITKLCIEKYVEMYANLYGIEYRICRPANVYGEGQRLNIGQGVIGVFLDRFMHDLPVEVWGSGNNKRDYIYVSDFVNAILALINYTGNQRIFNISTAVGHSLHDIIELIRKNSNLQVNIQYKPFRCFDVSENILDNKLLKKHTDWVPVTNLSEGIKRVYNWLKFKT